MNNNVALRPQRLDFISLCTGGAGLDLAVELAIPSARPVVLVEGEAWSVATLVAAMQANLLAPAPVWGDVRTFDGRPWRGLVDGLIGGIPCQPHSLAGKRLAEEDERDLWAPTRRIIVQSRPWFVLIENVRGFVTSGGLERVWRDLRRLGFQVEVGLFTAAEVGASHERERCFVLAVADCDSDAVWRQHGPGSGGELVNATSERRREGRTEPSLRSGRDAPAGASCAMADADVIELRQEPSAGKFPLIQRDDALSLFPPGPSNHAAWQAILEGAPERIPALSRYDRFRLALRAARIAADGDPAARKGLDPNGPYGLRAAIVSQIAQHHLRGLADGLGDGLDETRIEELRMLGNGVVSLEAAYALRTLSTRLAARGSAGAAELVRLMHADITSENGK